MVRAVRAGRSMRAVATRFKVSVSTIAFWVQRAAADRLHRVDFSDRAPGCARGWNRATAELEQRIVELRQSLRESSVLGEYGAQAGSPSRCQRACRQGTLPLALSWSNIQASVSEPCKLLAVRTPISGPSAILRSSIKSKQSTSALPAATSGRYQPFGGAGRRMRRMPSCNL